LFLELNKQVAKKLDYGVYRINNSWNICYKNNCIKIDKY
jgi:hypothetical protein